MDITLGPAPSTWGKSKIKDFYRQVADIDVDIVYIGETVCAKRRVLSNADFQEITDLLKRSGKKVFTSSLILISTIEEIEETSELFSLGDGIEANSVAILDYCSSANLKYNDKILTAGASINVYNRYSVKWLADFGVKRVAPPIEVDHKGIADLATVAPEVEITAWGNPPCSISWRCFTARALDIDQQDCRRRCLSYPNGMTLTNIDNQEIFIANGPQIVGAKTYCLIEHLDVLKNIGVNAIRLLPDLEHMQDIVKTFRACLNGEKKPSEAVLELAPLAPYGLSDGWLFGKGGIVLTSKENCA